MLWTLAPCAVPSTSHPIGGQLVIGDHGTEVTFAPTNRGIREAHDAPMKLFDVAKAVATPRRPVSLLVDGGRVWCPNRGDIAVEECAACSRFVAYDGRELACRDVRPWWFSETV
jgi:hypothetical protein